MKHTIGDIVLRQLKYVCFMNNDISEPDANGSVGAGLAYVFPLAGKPTVIITIRPEWKSRPDSVL